MGTLNSGVQSYFIGWILTAHGRIENGFPIEFNGNAHIDCAHCRWYSVSSKRCKITDAIPMMPERYIGDNCPLIFEEDDFGKYGNLG